MATPDHAATALWPLPLFIALLLFGGTHLAWWLSVQGGYIPACMPYWEGCVSVSRAARHGLGNHLFRLAILPCAVLQLLNWWLARAYLRGPRPGEDRASAALFTLGVSSALALAVYATFLGTDGDVYRFLRRYGVIVFFGCGYLAQLLFMRLSTQRGKSSGGVASAMVVVGMGMLGLGVANVAVGVAFADPAIADRWENAFEWQLGLLLVAWYVLLAILWKRDGFAMVVARGIRRTS